jgi:hypothetical protein
MAIGKIWSRPWFINTAILLGLLIYIFLLPDEMFGVNTERFLQALVLSAAWWAKKDADALLIRNRQKRWGGIFATPWRVFWLVLLVFPVFLPLYIVYRQRLIDNRIPLIDPPAEDFPRSEDISNDPDSSRTDYVILIHGTFATPRRDSHQWYDISSPGSFAANLHDRLKNGPLGDAVLRGSVREFSWCGNNRHEDRTEAGKRLCLLMMQITQESPAARIHLVGHSHGGNVILEAVREFIALHAERRQVTKTLGRVVFLGTPFYHKFWPIKGRFRKLLALPIELVGVTFWSLVAIVLNFQYWLMAAGVMAIAWHWWVTRSIDLGFFYRSVEFWTWSPLAKTVGACVLAGYALSALFKLSNARPIDSNLYFDVNRLTSGVNYFISLATFGLWKPPLAPAIDPETFVTTYRAIPRIKALVLTSCGSHGSGNKTSVGTSS